MLERHLRNFKHLQSRDLDETRSLVAGIFCEHRLDLMHRNTLLDYSHRHARSADLSFSVMRYGAEVRIEPQELKSFFLVQLPLAGSDRLELGRRTVHSTAGNGSIHCPDESFTMNWSADCSKLAVRIDRGAMERHAASLLGTALRQPLRFETEMNIRSGNGLAWKQTVHRFLKGMHQNPVLFEHPQMRNQLEQLLMSGLLVWQPNSLSELLCKPVPDVQPRHIRLTEEYMRAHLDTPITAELLASLTGVSVRTLYAGFRKFRGVSPMRYLRELRMERIREDLLDTEKPRSVTAIATHWGFFELGRFSAEYRKRYGESPSDSLRRSV